MFTARLVLSSRLVRFHSVAAMANARPTIGYTTYFHNQQLRYFADKNSFIAEAISRSVADENKELRTADGLGAQIESNEKDLVRWRNMKNFLIFFIYIIHMMMCLAQHSEYAHDQSRKETGNSRHGRGTSRN